MQSQRKTEVVPISATMPEPDRIARAASILRDGRLVAFPTETVYGLGANALDAEAVARIFQAKGRPANNPVIVHVAEPDDVCHVADAWPEIAARLAARFWPGPLTLVLPKSKSVPGIVTAQGATVAVRIPAHPVALALIRAAGVPVAAPSANRSCRLSPTCAEHVWNDLNSRIDMILDAGPTTGGLESTVLDVTSSPPRLLRPGLISPSEIEAVIGPIARSSFVTSVESSLPSPGMMPRHYAPKAGLECANGPGRERVEEWRRQGLRVGWLTFSDQPNPRDPNVLVRIMPLAPAAYGVQLYQVLHALDKALVDRIVVELPPDQDEWLAVRDRLVRASAKG